MNRDEFVRELETRKDWRAFQSNLKDDRTSYLRSFKKWVRDEKRNKKFAVHAHLYDLPSIGAGPQHGVQFKAQFNGLTDEEDHPCFNVSLFFEGQTPDEVVEFYEEIWEKMDCDFYEKYR